MSRLYWVDGLKGICAIIVVLCHTMVTIENVDGLSRHSYPVIHNLWDGNFAVSVFIVLSTILTCHGIETHRKDLLNRYRYLVLKRYFRLLVPVGFIIIVMYLANLLGAFHAEEYGAKTGNSWLTDVTVPLVHLPGSILFAPLGGGYTVLRVAWMLRYVCLGTMWVVILDLLLAGRELSSKLFLLSICIYIAWKTDFYYVNVVAGYAIYAFGDVLFANKLLRILLGGVIVTVFIGSDFFRQTDEWNMVRAVCVVLFAFVCPAARKVLSAKLPVWLGHISMNIYLLQLLVIYSVTCRMADFLPYTFMNLLAMYVITLCGVIVVAYFYTKYIENRLNTITEMIVNRIR